MQQSLSKINGAITQKKVISTIFIFGFRNEIKN
jgi:hypothetical protein